MAILESWHAQHEVVKVFNVAVPLAFVAQANHKAIKFDVCEGHVVGGARHHHGQVIGRFVLATFLRLAPPILRPWSSSFGWLALLNACETTFRSFSVSDSSSAASCFLFLTFIGKSRPPSGLDRTLGKMYSKSFLPRSRSS